MKTEHSQHIQVDHDRGVHDTDHRSPITDNRSPVTDHRSPVYPFTALVGQETLKQSLLLNAVNPAIGGVLIRGEKGTAKSTAVRGLAALLPEIEVVPGCGFACDPGRPRTVCERCRRSAGKSDRVRRRVRVVDLPLNATEDRVAGGIDFSRAVQQGRRTLQPGLLAAAHRGFLYVDEVNLLDDHIVDIILDAAASGVSFKISPGRSLSWMASSIRITFKNELLPEFWGSNCSRIFFSG